MNVVPTKVNFRTFQPPANYAEKNSYSDNQLFLEDLSNEDNELWLFQTCRDFDPSCLKNKVVSLQEETIFENDNCLLEDKCHKISVSTNSVSKLLGYQLLLPSRSRNGLFPAPLPLVGHFSLTEHVINSALINSPQTLKNKKEDLSDLKQRYVPFGSNEPLVTPKHKHTKKFHKKHLCNDTSSSNTKKRVSLKSPTPESQDQNMPVNAECINAFQPSLHEMTVHKRNASEKDTMPKVKSKKKKHSDSLISIKTSKHKCRKSYDKDCSTCNSSISEMQEASTEYSLTESEPTTIGNFEIANSLQQDQHSMTEQKKLHKNDSRENIMPEEMKQKKKKHKRHHLHEFASSNICTSNKEGSLLDTNSMASQEDESSEQGSNLTETEGNLKHRKSKKKKKSDKFPENGCTDSSFDSSLFNQTAIIERENSVIGTDHSRKGKKTDKSRNKCTISFNDKSFIQEATTEKEGDPEMKTKSSESKVLITMEGRSKKKKSSKTKSKHAHNTMEDDCEREKCEAKEAIKIQKDRSKSEDQKYDKPKVSFVKAEKKFEEERKYSKKKRPTKSKHALITREDNSEEQEKCDESREVLINTERDYSKKKSKSVKLKDTFIKTEGDFEMERECNESKKVLINTESDSEKKKLSDKSSKNKCAIPSYNNLLSQEVAARNEGNSKRRRKSEKFEDDCQMNRICNESSRNISSASCFSNSLLNISIKQEDNCEKEEKYVKCENIFIKTEDVSTKNKKSDKYSRNCADSCLHNNLINQRISIKKEDQFIHQKDDAFHHQKPAIAIKQEFLSDSDDKFSHQQENLGNTTLLKKIKPDPDGNSFKVKKHTKRKYENSNNDTDMVGSSEWNKAKKSKLKMDSTSIFKNNFLCFKDIFYNE